VGGGGVAEVGAVGRGAGAASGTCTDTRVSHPLSPRVAVIGTVEPYVHLERSGSEGWARTGRGAAAAASTTAGAGEGAARLSCLLRAQSNGTYARLHESVSIASRTCFACVPRVALNSLSCEGRRVECRVWANGGELPCPNCCSCFIRAPVTGLALPLSEPGVEGAGEGGPPHQRGGQVSSQPMNHIALRVPEVLLVPFKDSGQRHERLPVCVGRHSHALRAEGAGGVVQLRVQLVRVVHGQCGTRAGAPHQRELHARVPHHHRRLQPGVCGNTVEGVRAKHGEALGDTVRVG
jgi:hypothetical protein